MAGGVLGTLFALSRERRAEFRTRKLHAADDFLQALTTASAHVAEVTSIFGDPEPLAQSEVGVAFRRLEVARDEVLSTLARIDLLFGRGTPTWTSASSAYQAIHGAVGSLTELRAGYAGAKTTSLPTPTRSTSQLTASARRYGTTCAVPAVNSLASWEVSSADCNVGLCGLLVGSTSCDIGLSTVWESSFPDCDVGLNDCLAG